MRYRTQRRRVGIYKPIRSNLITPNLVTLNEAPDRLLWLDASSGVITRGAAAFPGSTSHYLSRPEATSRSLSPGNTDFWVAGWVRRNDLAGFQGVAGRYGTGSSNHREWLLQFREDIGGAPAFTISANGAGFTRVDYGTAPTVGVWNFYFAYFDAANARLSIRMNDWSWTAPVSHSGGVATNLVGFTVGCWINSGTASNPLNGTVDQLCFGSSPAGGIASARDAISGALYNGGSGLSYANLTPAQKASWGLVSFWELNKTSGTRADSHGSNDLSEIGTVAAVDGLVESPAVDQDPAARWGDVVGGHGFSNATVTARPAWRSAGYLDFDGGDDQLSHGATGGLIGNRSEFTYLAKVRLDTLPTSTPAVIFEEADASGGVVNRLSVTPAGQIVASYRPAGGTLRSATAEVALSAGTDSTLGVRRDGTSLRVFVNGSASGSEAIVDSGADLTGAIPRVGGPVVSSGFSRIDGRLYGLWAAAQAFTDPQVSALSADF